MLPLPHKLHQTNRMTIFDLDGSLAEGDMESRAEVRHRANKRSATVFATARTPELCMSSGAHKNSVKFHGFNRPEPHISLRHDRHWYAPPESAYPFQSLLDPLGIVAFGTGNYEYVSESFRECKGFTRQDFGCIPWRKMVEAMMENHKSGDGVFDYMPPLEQPHAYKDGQVNVAQLPYRIQLNLPSLAAKERVIETIQQIRSNPRSIYSYVARSIVFVDESNPDEGRYTLYLVPKWATKERAVYKFIDTMSRNAELHRGMLKVLYAGDTLTDLRAGLYGTKGTEEATFVLVGGSRIMRALKSGQPFAGEDLKWVSNRLKSHPNKKAGYYVFDKTTVVLGDEAYRGTVGAETIYEFMKENYY